MSPRKKKVARHRNDTFLFCPECGAAHRETPSDRAPEFSADGTEGTTDDAKAFREHHEVHGIRTLWRESDAELLSHSRSDPLCQISWELTDGRSAYVVTSEREDVSSPRRYRIRRGRLVQESEFVEIDTEVLAKVVDEALFPASLPPNRLDAWVEACRRQIEALSPGAYDPIDEDRGDPSVQLACLPELVASRLRAETKQIFSDDEDERLGSLLDDELRSQIPIVRVHRRFSVIED